MSNPKIIIEPDGFIIDELKISKDLLRNLANLRDPDTIQARNTLSRNCLWIVSEDKDGLVDREFFHLMNSFYEILQNLDGEKTSKTNE